MNSLVRPRSLREARDAILEAQRMAKCVRFRGAESSARSLPDTGAGVVVDTTALTASCLHEAGDLTLVATAGASLSDLNQMLAKKGQRIAQIPPSASRGATLGGAISASDCGPLRHRFGGWRDVVLGMTVVLADGKVVRCGGRVIKNVAGYDLAKLFCGALGTLGLVAEAVLRLHPLPEHRLSVRFDGARQSLHQLLAEILRSPLVPSALDYAQGSLWCRFEGSCQGTRAQAARSESQAGELGIRVTRIEGKEEEEEWVRVAEKTAGANAASEVSVVRAVTLPDALSVAETALETAAEERGVQAEMASHAGIGLHTARLAGGGPADHGAVISAWRDALSRMGGTVSIRRPMPGLDPAGLTGPPPPSLPLMKAVKLALDPEGRLEPGRFSPWW